MNYNPYGQITSLVDARGNTTYYTLTSWDQKASETRPEGLKIEYEYDANGNITRTREVFTGGTREILTTYNSLDKPTLIRSEYAP